MHGMAVLARLYEPGCCHYWKPSNSGVGNLCGCKKVMVNMTADQKSVTCKRCLKIIRKGGII